jgi:hypothetical protein
VASLSHGIPVFEDKQMAVELLKNSKPIPYNSKEIWFHLSEFQKQMVLEFLGISQQSLHV